MTIIASREKHRIIALYSMEAGLTNTKELITALAQGQTALLEALYERHREGFFRWASRRIACSKHDLEDAWQEAVFAFYEQVVSQKITALQYSERTWLFAVGYRRLLNFQRKTKRIFWTDEIDDVLIKDPTFQQFPGEEPLAEEQANLLTVMSNISPGCRDLLRQRFFLEKSISEILLTSSHQSSNALSVSLSRCLKRLKEMMRKITLN